jgi:hypothetical protein
MGDGLICVSMWNLGKPQVFSAGSPLPHSHSGKYPDRIQTAAAWGLLFVDE